MRTYYGPLSFEMNSIHLKRRHESFSKKKKYASWIEKNLRILLFLQKSRNIQHRISILKEIFSLFISKKNQLTRYSQEKANIF